MSCSANIEEGLLLNAEGLFVVSVLCQFDWKMRLVSVYYNKNCRNSRRSRSSGILGISRRARIARIEGVEQQWEKQKSSKE